MTEPSNSIHMGSAIRVIVHGSVVGVTPWFNDIDATPSWFQMDLHNVDRIVIESVPANLGGGWYGMDNLTYVVPEPATLSLLALSALTAIRRKRK